MKMLRFISFFIRLVKVILATCGFNLLVIGIIIVLLTFFDQGAPLLVDLLTSPGNVLLFWVIIIGTALAYGHYPVYSFKWKKTRHIFRQSDGIGKTKWKLNSPQLWGVGIITYSDPYLPDAVSGDPLQIKLDKAFHAFRGLLGLAFILAIFYCLVYSYQTFIGSENTSEWFSGVLILLFISYFYPGRISESWIIRIIWITFLLFTVLATFNLYLSFSASSWNAGIFWTFNGALALFSLLYIFFKNHRSRLHQNQFIFASHVNYLMLVAGCGVIAFVTIVMSQFYPAHFNPIVILLAYFNVIYGIYVNTLKHRLYYFSQARINATPDKVRFPNTSLFFRLIAPLFLMVLGLWIIIAGICGNNLHQLPLVPDRSPLTLHEFLSNFNDRINQEDSKLHDTLYFIASYGGGLKANAWNLMVMDTLDKLGILESTVAISGVSGGNLGQFLYGGLNRTNQKIYGKNKKIQKISTHNFLSRDLAWLLGWDFVRELDIFSKKFKPDRALKSLQVYQDKLGDTQLTGQGMRSYWKSIYENKGHYPVLISNSAGVNNRRDISCSVQFPEQGTTFEKTFPGAVNLLEYKDHPTYSLSYLGAASTSNRFPFLSPAAKIPEKGHYVDGGYFENSGMFSLLNFYEALEKDSSWANIFQGRTIVFLQIANHKSTYIRQMVPDSLIQINKMAEVGEILQVLETKASTEFLPYYFEQKIRWVDSLHIEKINIPYKFTIADIKKQFHARSLKPGAEDKIQLIIRKNDQYIDSLYKEAGYSHWEAIEPATARLLSLPAVNYMKMAIAHDQRIDVRYR